MPHGDPAAHHDVRAQLARIVASSGFVQAPRLQHFLAFVVEETLLGRADQLKEYVVGTQVFGKAADFDPRIDASVRVSASKLRQRLDEWYQGPGRHEAVRIVLARGSYVPTFQVREATAAPAAKRVVRTVAVLPFMNLGHADDAGLADGLAEEVMHALTRAQSLRVIARTSAFAWRERQGDVREVGRTLGADVIVQGSVRRAGARVRVTAQLVETADGVTMWTNSWERDELDVFELQDAVSLDVVGALQIEISADQRMRLSQRHTSSGEAFRLYLRGRRATLEFHPNALPSALALFHQARAADPRYPLPLVGIAEASASMALWGLEPPGRLMEQARVAVEAALALEPDLAEAHALKGTIAARFDFDFRTAEQCFRHAVALNPSSSTACVQYALTTLSPLGRLDEAVEFARRAMTVDPLDPYSEGTYHWLVSLTGQTKSAAERLQQVVALQPDDMAVRFVFASVLISAERYREAIDLLQRLIQATGPRPVCLGFLAAALARAGERAAALAIRDDIQQMAQHLYVQPMSLVMANTALRELDDAFAALDRAFADRDSPLIHLAVEPAFNELRGDRRFALACERLGVPAPADGAATGA